MSLPFKNINLFSLFILYYNQNHTYLISTWYSAPSVLSPHMCFTVSYDLFVWGHWRGHNTHQSLHTWQCHHVSPLDSWTNIGECQNLLFNNKYTFSQPVSLVLWLSASFSWSTSVTTSSGSTATSRNIILFITSTDKSPLHSDHNKIYQTTTSQKIIQIQFNKQKRKFIKGLMRNNKKFNIITFSIV